MGMTATNPCVTRNHSVAVTGGLTADGTVVEVQYVAAKARKAAELGLDAILVPAGQSVDVADITVIETKTFAQARDYGLNRDPTCLS
jgi:predicted S18 family serine protease